MRTTDLWLKPMPGQFWFDQTNIHLYKMESYKDEYTVTAISCSDNKEYDFILPISSILLWYQTEIGKTNFDRETKPRQIWVDNLSDEVFIIHPEQSESTELVKILSNSGKISNVYRAYTLVYDPDQEIIDQVHNS